MEENILLQEDAEVSERLSVNRLTPENSLFYETEGGFVALKLDGEDKGMVNIIRTFPLTEPDKFLSVRNPDDKQEEYGMIEDINLFGDDTVMLLQKQLKLRYYMPKITQIVAVKEEYGYTYWTVETDCGSAKFASSSGSAGAVIKHGKGVIVKDSNENRYIIEDLEKLTVKELKKLDLYL